MATSKKFWVVSHDRLAQMLKFGLLSNNMLQAVGELWSREGGQYAHEWAILCSQCGSAYPVGG